MKLLTLPAAGALLALTGCMPMSMQSQVVYQDPTSTYDPAAIRAALQPGHSTITGQAFAKTRGGDVKFAAGNTILLIPMTTYVRECIAVHRDGYASMCGDKIAADARKIVADGEGRFTATGLLPGTYHLETTLMWEVPGAYGMQTTGGTLSADATIASDGDVVTIYLQ